MNFKNISDNLYFKVNENFYWMRGLFPEQGIFLIHKTETGMEICLVQICPLLFVDKSLKDWHQIKFKTLTKQYYTIASLVVECHLFKHSRKELMTKVESWFIKV